MKLNLGARQARKFPHPSDPPILLAGSGTRLRFALTFRGTIYDVLLWEVWGLTPEDIADTAPDPPWSL